MIRSLIQLCDNCGCARYPFCNINGGICPDCMQNRHNHKNPDPECPGRFLDTETPKNNDSEFRQESSNIEFREIPAESNGDCLFSCVVQAFNNTFSIEELRDAVARKQTTETFRAYKQLQKTEFPYMKPMSRLADFRGYIRKRGMYFGATNCYWGDENALETFSQNLRTRFAIYKKRKQNPHKLQQVIGLNDNPFIMLLHTRDHYTLISWKKKKSKHWKTESYGNPPKLICIG